MWEALGVNLDDVLENRPGGIIRLGGGESGKFPIYGSEQPYWADLPRDDGLSAKEREHRARMAADHAETMRQARIGTWLLVAFVVAAGFRIAYHLGVLG